MIRDLKILFHLFFFFFKKGKINEWKAQRGKNMNKFNIFTLSVLQTLSYVLIIICWNDSRWTNRKTFQRHFGFIISTLLLKKLSITIGRDLTCYALMVAMAADLRPVWFSLGTCCWRQIRIPIKQHRSLILSSLLTILTVTDGSNRDIYWSLLKQH